MLSFIGNEYGIIVVPEPYQSNGTYFKDRERRILTEKIKNCFTKIMIRAIQFNIKTKFIGLFGN